MSLPRIKDNDICGICLRAMRTHANRCRSVSIDPKRASKITRCGNGAYGKQKLCKVHHAAAS